MNMIEFEKTSCLRVYYINDKQVNRVHFFKDGKILYSTRFGWIENIAWIDKDNYIHNSDISIDGLQIIEPVRKLKVNLNIKQNFYVKAKKEYTWSKDSYDLYLYVDDVNVKLEFRKDLYHVCGDMNSAKLTKYFYKIYDLYINGMPEACQVDDFKIEHEVTERGIELEQLSSDLEKDGIRIDKYYLEKLLAKYELVKRV